MEIIAQSGEPFAFSSLIISSYIFVFRSPLFADVQLVVWLDYPFAVVSYRLIKVMRPRICFEAVGVSVRGEGHLTWALLLQRSLCERLSWQVVLLPLALFLLVHQYYLNQKRRTQYSRLCFCSIFCFL
jgi:hypothetical protein